MFYRCLLILGLAGWLSSALACSDNNLAALNQFVGHKLNITTIDCGIDSSDKNLTFVAVAYDRTDHGDDNIDYQLLIALVNNVQNQVIASYRTTLEEDASLKLVDDSFHITTRYQLADGIPAFALDITSRAPIPSYVEYWTTTTRSLYVRDGDKIKLILNNLDVDFFAYTKGHPDIPHENIDRKKQIQPIIETFKTTVDKVDTSTNGLADLIVTIISSSDSDDYIQREPFGYLLTYDGKQYDRDSLTDLFHESIDDNSVDKLIKRCTHSASSNCMKVGRLYRDGENVEQSYENSAYYYQLACKNDYTGDACGELAINYYEPIGSYPMNLELAREYGVKACQFEHPKGCYIAGAMFELNSESDQDIETATQYYLKACQLSYQPACETYLVLSKNNI